MSKFKCLSEFTFTLILLDKLGYDIRVPAKKYNQQILFSKPADLWIQQVSIRKTYYVRSTDISSLANIWYKEECPP